MKVEYYLFIILRVKVSRLKTCKCSGREFLGWHFIWRMMKRRNSQVIFEASDKHVRPLCRGATQGIPKTYNDIEFLVRLYLVLAGPAARRLATRSSFS